MDLENPKKISNFFFGMTHKAVSTQGRQREIDSRGRQNLLKRPSA